MPLVVPLVPQEEREEDDLNNPAALDWRRDPEKPVTLGHHDALQEIRGVNNKLVVYERMDIP